MARAVHAGTHLILTLPLVAGVAYFVLMEHWQHFIEALPYLILLACPLMHLFMHGGHGHAHHEDRPSGE